MIKAWWLPALPGEAFEVAVSSIDEGKRILNVLVDYTRYLEGRGLVADYAADVGGLQALEDGEWFDAEFVYDDEAVWEYEPNE